MGKATRCICGYHKPKTSPSPVSTNKIIWNIWNKWRTRMHAWSIQNICTRLIYSEHLNLFQILSEIVSIKQSRWLVLDLTRVTPTRLKILLLVHRLEEERGLGKAPSGILYPRKSRSAPNTETPATWMWWGRPSDALEPLLTCQTRWVLKNAVFPQCKVQTGGREHYVKLLVSGNQKEKMWNASRISVSSLRRRATPLPHKLKGKKLEQLKNRHCKRRNGTGFGSTPCTLAHSSNVYYGTGFGSTHCTLTYSGTGFGSTPCIIVHCSDV